MDWINLISAILGSGITSTVAAGVVFFVFRKQNLRIKENEANATDIDIESKQLDLDKKQIDLGTEFMRSSLEMTRQVQSMLLSKQVEDEKNWTVMFSRIDSLEESVSHIKMFLNGEFKDFENGLLSDEQNN